MRAMLLLGLALGGVPGLAAQSLASRIEGVKEGTVRMSYAAREGVCGDGEHNITYSAGRRGEWVGHCAHGPVRVVVQRDGGRTTDIRTYVGGAWRGTATADLGTVGAIEASRWLLGVAERGEPAAEDAIMPATLADSAETWPALLRIARRAPRARKGAVFWLGPAAGDAATRGLDSIVNDRNGDREVRESAVFALSQRPHDEGVPALIRVARTTPTPSSARPPSSGWGRARPPRRWRCSRSC